MELLLPSPGLIFWQLVVFLLLLFVLSKYAWRPIMATLAERDNEIDSALRMAEETRAEMAKLKSDNDKLIAEARAERDAMIKTAKETADRMILDAKTTASTEASKILEDARQTIANERASMAESLRKEVGALSLEIAEKVMRKELASSEAQTKLVSDLLVDAKLN